MELPDHAGKDLEPEWFMEGENIRINPLPVADQSSEGETQEWRDSTRMVRPWLDRRLARPPRRRA